MSINSKVYGRLKFVTQIGLPALGTLYFAIAAIWHLPSPEQVVGTIVAVDTFLGVLLGLSQSSYNKQIAGGTLNVVKTPGGKTFSLEVNGDPEYELEGKKELRLKVAPHSHK